MFYPGTPENDMFVKDVLNIIDKIKDNIKQDNNSAPCLESRKKKYKKSENPNKRKGADDRKKSGDRERNVGHPDGEEHSRTPKGGFQRK
ncbi:hypothetical protein DENIS_0868 [Desulfonema ishimotonii]|uniref:Uncharacterized protein n=1 Tax=Desulfonema ishimotonii TaxID=45657 RepID=A0A401FSJ2_9BACT|nr:hypothetical protein DENIS_0868 [Desulfonema ishimotonii]